MTTIEQNIIQKYGKGKGLTLSNRPHSWVDADTHLRTNTNTNESINMKWNTSMNSWRYIIIENNIRTLSWFCVKNKYFHPELLQNVFLFSS